ncbi:MAG: hypothetical protein ACJ71T_01390 [Actinomycetales bacterium]
MIVLIVMGLVVLGAFWLLYRIASGMKRDEDAMQIGSYNAWSSPPPRPPFPSPKSESGEHAGCK